MADRNRVLSFNEMIMYTKMMGFQQPIRDRRDSTMSEGGYRTHSNLPLLIIPLYKTIHSLLFHKAKSAVSST